MKIHFPLWGGALLSFLIVTISLRVLLSWRDRLPVDNPTDRSLHFVPTPRIGGLALVPAWVLSLMIMGGGMTAEMTLVLVLFFFSFLDDRYDLPVLCRLFIHFLVAGAFLYSFRDNFFWVNLTFLVFVLVWGMNLFNFMDGSDGLSGGMAVIGFAVYGVAAVHAGDRGLALSAFAISAGSGGFLLYNFPPARLFLGDAGSIPLGFLAAALGLKGVLGRTWLPWFPCVVFAPFIFDATLTLIWRVFRKERFWVAHRSHYYQRLVLMGWSPRRLAVFGYMVMVGCGVLALFSPLCPQKARMGLFFVAGVFVLSILRNIDRRWAICQSSKASSK